MLYLLANRINIIIIILLTIKIIPLQGQRRLNNESLNANAELYGNFTVIEFLKELLHSKPTYESVLIMQNQNATISNIFHNQLINVLNRKNYSAAILTGVVCGEVPATTFVQRLMDSLQVPVLQLNELLNFTLKHQYNEHFLSIVYIDINIENIQMTLNDHKDLLEKLSDNLLHMRTSKVMFLINFPLAVKMASNGPTVVSATIDEDVIQGILVQLFRHCWKQSIINVVALLADYQVTRKFYSYNHFPKFQLEIKKIAFLSEEGQEIYPYRLGDMKGYALPILAGMKIPRIILYRKRNGEEVMGGFVGHLIRAFAMKYKCTLEQPLSFQLNESISEDELTNAVRADMVEFSIGITAIQRDFVGFTYPIHALNWCIMLPVKQTNAGYKFFTAVFKEQTYLLVIGIVIALSMVLGAALQLHGRHTDVFDIFCNCWRGILSQPFSEISNPPLIIRFIYLEICILGLLLTTTHLSYFYDYVTRPHKEAVLDSFDDILSSGLKIIVWRNEYNYLLDLKFQKYLNIFRVVENYDEFAGLRSSFNTSYGYGVSNIKWAIIKEQQQIFTNPIFELAQNLCIVNNIPMSFPIRENSIYHGPINQFILETTKSGLFSHWIDMGFQELIAAKKIQLKDLSGAEEFPIMTIEELRYILIFLGGMFVLVNLVFLGELIVFHRKSIYGKFTRAPAIEKTNFLE